MYRVAAIQMASGTNVNANLHETSKFITEAANMGAKLIILPENFALMAKHSQETLDICEPYGKGPLQKFLEQQASRHHIWLLGGTIPLAANDSQKVRSACLLFNDQGQCVARYDKMHLFDVVAGINECYQESDYIEPGQQIVVADTPFGKLGLAICYDLRFPELFRCMIDQGADLICLPAAFTATTGKAHWECLLRARAIENTCYLVTSNQGGYHVNGRETYGHSMIIDGWGTTLTGLAHGSGVICADLDLDQQCELRRKFPTIHHRKIQCQAP